jgi:LacI family transcriptional regulator
MTRKPANLQQVAERAGVSMATVSRVARGVGQVSPATRRKVADAIAELGFRPNQRARALVSRRHAALGVVFPGRSGPYHAELIAGFEATAVAAELSVLILGTHLLREPDELVLGMADRVDGIAVVAGAVPDALVTRLRKAGCPVVSLASEPTPGVPTVRAESVRSVRELTRHLLVDHGYAPLTFVGTPAGSPDTAERWRGFRQAHADAGLPIPRLTLAVSHDQAGGIIAAEQLFAARRQPRAVVCVNDEVALGLLLVALGRGVRVPADLAVTGFDDLPATALTSPSLTTIRQPIRELGGRAAATLRRAIEADPDIPADQVLPTEVARRASCGCPGPTASERTAMVARHTARSRRTVYRQPTRGEAR